MKRKNGVVRDVAKKQRLQQNIRSMFLHAGPMFVDAVGLQPVCRYCNRKFKAPQGLVVHMHMHERAGDVPLVNKLHQNLSSAVKGNPQRPPLVKSSNPQRRSQDAKSPVKTVVKKELASKQAEITMTRRFTVAEKIQIIEKFKEVGVVSETCRWVMKVFKRPTFDRKSLRKMLSREDIYRSAVGTKKVRKNVRPRTGTFNRMDNELARWVRETRSIGIPVESYMLEIEGERIMKEIYPDQFDDDGMCRFKFSVG